MSDERLFCQDCGEEEEFIKHWEEKRWFECDALCGADGEVDYADDENEVDGEVLDGSWYECDNCGWGEVKFLNEKEIIVIKSEHIDKKGKWHDEELEEDEKDPKLVAEAVAMQL